MNGVKSFGGGLAVLRALVIPLVLAAFAPSQPFAAKLNIVASVPDLGDMAREIGGNRVRVDVLASGREDFHAVPARPSYLPRLNKADLLLNLGLDAEHAWLPALAAEARNPRIREGAAGWVETYAGIRILNIPTRLDRSEGEQHPRGNPHYNVGPDNGKHMARNIAEAFVRVDPAGEAYYKERLSAYSQKLTSLEQDLKERGAALRGLKIVSHHHDVSYLAAFYGMEVIGSIEPKPGVSPSAGHLQNLTSLARGKGVQLVLHNQAQNPRLPARVASEIGAIPVEFLNMAGPDRNSQTWIELQEENLRRLLLALAQVKK
jgi:zinc/manganese transport system substrate-binding protein